MTELYAALQPVLDEHSNYHQQQSEAEQEDAGSERPVQLAIMGLPNVASSSALVPDPPPPPPSPYFLAVPPSFLLPTWCPAFIILEPPGKATSYLRLSIGLHCNILLMQPQTKAWRASSKAVELVPHIDTCIHGFCIKSAPA